MRTGCGRRANGDVALVNLLPVYVEELLDVSTVGAVRHHGFSGSWCVIDVALDDAVLLQLHVDCWYRACVRTRRRSG